MRKILLAILCCLAFGCTTIDPGEVGVEVSLGSIVPDVRTSGFHVTVIASIHKFSTRTQTYTMAGTGAEGDANGSVNVLAKDQLPIKLDVSVMFHLNGARAVEVYRALGNDYADSIVHPLVRTAVRDAASEFTAVELVDKRAELQLRMGTLVRGALEGVLRGRNLNTSSIQIDGILIRNIDLPQSIDDAIASVQRQRQATAAAEQANLTARQEAARALTIANGEVAQRTARAEGDANVVRIQALAEAARIRSIATAQAEANRTLAQSLTPAVLRYEQIRASTSVLASNGTRTIFVPGSMNPTVMLNNQ